MNTDRAEAMMDMMDQWDVLVAGMQGLVNKMVAAGYSEEQSREFVLAIFAKQATPA